MKLNLVQLFDCYNIQRFTLGRNGLLQGFDCPSLSRSHALIQKTPHGEFEIIDLNSLNGVIVNGEKVSAKILKNGDNVTLGNVTFAVETAYPEEDLAFSIPQWG